MRAILSRIGVNPDILLDALGAASIFVFLGVGVWLAYGLGLPTGGEELIERVP